MAPDRRAGTSVRRRRMESGGRTHGGVVIAAAGPHGQRARSGWSERSQRLRPCEHDHRADQYRCRRPEAGGRLLDEVGSLVWSSVVDERRQVRHSQPPGNEVVRVELGERHAYDLCLRPIEHARRRRRGRALAWRARDSLDSGTRVPVGRGPAPRCTRLVDDRLDRMRVVDGVRRRRPSRRRVAARGPLLRAPVAGSGRWFSENAATTPRRTHPRANGRRRASPTTPAAASAMSTASTPGASIDGHDLSRAGAIAAAAGRSRPGADVEHAPAGDTSGHPGDELLRQLVVDAAGAVRPTRRPFACRRRRSTRRLTTRCSP